MQTIRRALAPLTFVVLMALLFASVFLGALLGPTLLLITPVYVYLGGGVARFAFAELARGRAPMAGATSVVPPTNASEEATALQPSPQRVAPVIA